jgi:Dyp-type peroxidase family
MNNVEDRLQDGIFHDSSIPRNNFCALFLTVSPQATAEKVGLILRGLWKMLEDLKKGISRELVINKRNLKSGYLTVLLSYGSSIFAVDGIKRTRPVGLSSKFSSPQNGGSIVEGSELRFNSELEFNHASSDHLFIQFTGENEFITNRAVVETWKYLELAHEGSAPLLFISKIYSGFLSDTRRNWMGFHDGVSNIMPKKRRKAIAIGPLDITNHNEEWLINGTYVSFLRIEINLKTWNTLDLYEQELLIGRDKLTGCPLIAIDRNGKPIKSKSCPIPGTFEVIEPGNEHFRDQSPFGYHGHLPYGFTDSILKESHIARALNYDPLNRRVAESLRIYRQGYNFFEPNTTAAGFKLGLNFVSFQNDPQKLFGILKAASKSGVHYKQAKPQRILEEFVFVNAAGLFFVPSLRSTETFPGESIFR